MAIPDYEIIMLPLLKFASNGNEYSSKEAVESLSRYFKLTEKDKNQLYATMKISIFYDRTHWAITYLKKAGLLIGTNRGFFKITDRGKHVLSQNLKKIDNKCLKQFPEFKEFQKNKRKDKSIALKNKI